MDIHQVITDLRSERDRLNEIIRNLEHLQQIADEQEGAPKRRGRKFMDSAARQEVSVRMKRYWERRRSERSQAQGAGTPDGQEPDPAGDSARATTHSAAA